MKQRFSTFLAGISGNQTCFSINWFVAICFIILISSNANAQSTNMLFGIHVGGNYSLFSPNAQSVAISNIGSDQQHLGISNPSFFGNTGLQFGINLIQPINDVLAIELAPEQFNSRTNYHTRETINGNTSFEITREISSYAQYYRFPLSLMYWKREGKIQPYAFAGLSYGFLSNAGSKSVENISTTLPDGTIRNTSSSNDVYSNESYVKSRFDVLGGVGVMYDLNLILIGLDARFNFLLNNLTSTGNRFRTANGLGSGANQKFHSPAIELKILLKIDSSGGGLGALDCTYGPYTKSRKR
jgi:hypothetical protein